MAYSTLARSVLKNHLIILFFVHDRRITGGLVSASYSTIIVSIASVFKAVQSVLFCEQNG